MDPANCCAVWSTFYYADFQQCFWGCFQIVAVEATADNLATIQEQHSVSDGCVYHLQEGQFVMPGLIDTHIHAPQYPNAGVGYDKQLLDWLTTYTFPLEKQFTDQCFANKVYEAIVVSELQL
jgi:guanine deaminase